MNNESTLFCDISLRKKSTLYYSTYEHRDRKAQRGQKRAVFAYVSAHSELDAIYHRERMRPRERKVVILRGGGWSQFLFRQGDIIISYGTAGGVQTA
jgi:hypothetical protein